MTVGHRAAGQGYQVGLHPFIHLSGPVDLVMVPQHLVQSLLGIPPLGAELLPALIIFLSRLFSCVASRTPYFSCTMTTSHPTTLRLVPSARPGYGHRNADY